MSAYQRKGISTLSPAVSAVISGMLYSSGAVAVIIQPLPNPVGTIAGEYYVSIGEGATPRDVNEEEITYNGNLKLFGNIADANAEGAVNGKTFDVSSKFTKNETSLFNVSIYAGYSNGNGDVTYNKLNFEGSTDTQSTLLDKFYLYGGYSQNGNANGNAMISSGSIKAQNDITVYGGYSYNGSADSNSITISGGELSANVVVNVYGGYSLSVSVNENKVTISGWKLSSV